MKFNRIVSTTLPFVLLTYEGGDNGLFIGRLGFTTQLMATNFALIPFEDEHGAINLWKALKSHRNRIKVL